MKESASIKQIHLKDLRSMTFARAPVMKTRERESGECSREQPISAFKLPPRIYVTHYPAIFHVR